MQNSPAMSHNRAPGAMIDVDRLIDELEEVGQEWADAKAAADALEDSKKSVLAEALRRADGKTVGEREAVALTDAGYLSHLRVLADSRKRSNRARVRYDIAQIRIELIRTNASTQRAAMSMR